MATDWGSLIGSVLGTGIGSFGGPVTAGIGGMIGGGIGSMFDTPKKGQPPIQEVLYAKDYPWMADEGWGQYGGVYPWLVKWGQEQMAGYNAGEPSAAFKKLSPMLSEKAKRGVYETYYGVPGLKQGILPTLMNFEALRGTQGASGSRAMSAQQMEYAKANQDIDTYMAGLEYQDWRRTGEYVPSLLSNLPQGPRAVGIASFPGTQAESGWGDALSGLGSALPWLMNMSGWGGNANTSVTNLPMNANYLDNPAAQLAVTQAIAGYNPYTAPATVSSIPSARVAGQGYMSSGIDSYLSKGQDFSKSFTWDPNYLDNYQLPWYAR